MGGGTLQVGDLCRVEDGRECSGTHGSDVVVLETASEGQSRELRERRLNGPDTQADTCGGGALEGGNFCLAQHLGELGHALISDTVFSETTSQGRSGEW